jgi:hypothetical protein
MKLSDAVCEDLNVQPQLPALSLNYLYYLHSSFTSDAPPSNPTLTLLSPCDANAAKSFPVKFFSTDVLQINSHGDIGAIRTGIFAAHMTPIGARPESATNFLDPTPVS